MKQVCQLLKAAGTDCLVTMEGDPPRVRPFGTAHIFEEKLYTDGQRQSGCKAG